MACRTSPKGLSDGNFAIPVREKAYFQDGTNKMRGNAVIVAAAGCCLATGFCDGHYGPRLEPESAPATPAAARGTFLREKEYICPGKDMYELTDTKVLGRHFIKVCRLYLTAFRRMLSDYPFKSYLEDIYPANQYNGQ